MGRPGLTRSPGTVAVFLVLMIDSLASGLFIPLSMLYFTASSGASLARVGTLLGLAGLVSLPLPLWVGRLVDRVGARSVVLVSLLVQAAGFAGYLAAWNVVAVFAAATVASLGQRAFWSSIFVLVSGLSDHDPDPRARERWFGAIGALRAVGYGIGTLVAGLALTVDSLALTRTAVAANAVALLVSAGLVAAGIPRVPAPGGSPHRGGYRALVRDRPYLALIGLNSVFALCNVMLSVGFPPFVARGLPGVVWVVGPLLTMNTVAQAVCQPFVVRMLRAVPRHVSLCLAGMLWAVWGLATAGGLYTSSALRVPTLVLAILCYSAAQLVHSPVSNALATDAAPVALRGRYLAAFQYSFAVATVVAPTMFSVLFGLGEAVPWVTLAVLAASTVPAALMLARHLPPGTVSGIPLRPDPDQRRYAATKRRGPA